MYNWANKISQHSETLCVVLLAVITPFYERAIVVLLDWHLKLKHVTQHVTSPFFFFKKIENETKKTLRWLIKETMSLYDLYHDSVSDSFWIRKIRKWNKTQTNKQNNNQCSVHSSHPHLQIINVQFIRRIRI